MLRAGGNAVDAAVASVLVSFASEPLLTGPGAGGFMLLTSPVGAQPPAGLLRGRSRARPGGPAAGAAGAGRGGVLARDDPDLQRGRLLLRRVRQPGRPGLRAGALRHDGAGRPDPGGGQGRARGGPRSRRSRSTCCASWARSSAPRPRARRCTSPRATRWWRASACPCPSWPTCWTAWAPRARASCTRATWQRPSATGCCERGGLLTTQDLADYQVVERAPGRRRLPRPARADQPAAVLGRDPDRRRAGAAGPARPPGRHRDGGRGHRRDQPGARPRVRAGAAQHRLRAPVPGPRRAGPGGGRDRLAAGLDHPRVGHGRRRRGGHGDVLERLVLGDRGARHRACT